MPQFEIQMRQKGAWQRWIGMGDRAKLNDIWTRMHYTSRAAARFVSIEGDAMKVLAKKPAGIFQ